MVLQIDAGLAAFYSATEAEDPAGIEIENFRVATAIDEKAFQLAQTSEVDAGLENVSMPELNQVTLDANRKRAARADGKRRVRIGSGEDSIATDALIDGARKDCIGRKRVSPGEDGGLLAKMARGIATRILIFRQVGLLEIC